jgi:hypothetical protein
MTVKDAIETIKSALRESEHSARSDAAFRALEELRQSPTE